MRPFRLLVVAVVLDFLWPEVRKHAVPEGQVRSVQRGGLQLLARRGSNARLSAARWARDPSCELEGERLEPVLEIFEDSLCIPRLEWRSPAGSRLGCLIRRRTCRPLRLGSGPKMGGSCRGYGGQGRNACE
jgi:hypothetical protein